MYRDPFFVNNPHITGQYNPLYTLNKLPWSFFIAQMISKVQKNPNITSYWSQLPSSCWTWSRTRHVIQRLLSRCPPQLSAFEEYEGWGGLGRKRFFFSMDHTVDGSKVQGATCFFNENLWNTWGYDDILHIFNWCSIPSINSINIRHHSQGLSWSNKLN